MQLDGPGLTHSVCVAQPNIPVYFLVGEFEHQYSKWQYGIVDSVWLPEARDLYPGLPLLEELALPPVLLGVSAGVPAERPPAPPAAVVSGQLLVADQAHRQRGVVRTWAPPSPLTITTRRVTDV